MKVDWGLRMKRIKGWVRFIIWVWLISWPRMELWRERRDGGKLFVLVLLEVLIGWVLYFGGRLCDAKTAISVVQKKISQVPPREYGGRFLAFMRAIMRGGEGGTRFKWNGCLYRAWGEAVVFRNLRNKTREACLLKVSGFGTHSVSAGEFRLPSHYLMRLLGYDMVVVQFCLIQMRLDSSLLTTPDLPCFMFIFSVIVNH